uniref:HU family DNA-binding protein n=1 Tax=uncultured Acinetobacter sp. TaxID=165433 RepID=UPI00260E527C|nr:HU family DNA-binding protein [uncultured Acinetobacter sp.]
MNKPELINAIAAKTGIKKTTIGEVIDALTNTVTEELANGGEVALIGFGTFSVKDRAERTGRNPKTGEPLHLPASKAPVFKAGKGLKEAVN